MSIIGVYTPMTDMTYVHKLCLVD